MSKIFKFVIAGLLLCILGASSLVSTRFASAQYVALVGNLTCTASNSTPRAGETVTITCTVRDAAGALVGGMPVTFVVSTEPGRDAAAEGLKAVIIRTGTNGEAVNRTFVGTTPGTLVIDVTAPLGIGSRLVINVQPAASTTSPAMLSSSALASQQQVAVAQIAPPRTGDGGLVDRGGSNRVLTAGLIVAALMLSGAVFAGRRSAILGVNRPE